MAGVVVLVTAVNVRGIRLAAWTVDAFTIAKLVPLGLLLAARPAARERRDARDPGRGPGALDGRRAADGLPIRRLRVRRDRRLGDARPAPAHRVRAAHGARRGDRHVLPRPAGGGGRAAARGVARDAGGGGARGRGGAARRAARQPGGARLGLRLAHRLRDDDAPHPVRDGGARRAARGALAACTGASARLTSPWSRTRRSRSRSPSTARSRTRPACRS